MWKIIYCILTLAIIPCTDGPSQRQSVQEATAHYVIGRCHDKSTAVGLKANVYAVVKQSRQQLATCKADGLFNVLVPTSATHLVLEATGYRSVTIPIHFTPDIPVDAQFQVWNWAMMTPVDSLLTPMTPTEENFLSLSFSVPDSEEVDNVTYTLTSLTTAKSKWISLSIKALQRGGGRGLPFSVEPGAYTAAFATKDGRLISSEKITTGPGITFKAVRVVNPTRAMTSGDRLPGINLAASTPTTTILYFDQSSHELRAESKSRLDSLAQLLVSQPNIVATVIGFTDNVGKREVNLSLSEYRAKTVERYLQRHGVRADQLRASWKGPDSTASPTDAELIKSRSRRVVIQLIPK